MENYQRKLAVPKLFYNGCTKHLPTYLVVQGIAKYCNGFDANNYLNPELINQIINDKKSSKLPDVKSSYKYLKKSGIIVDNHANLDAFTFNDNFILVNLEDVAKILKLNKTCKLDLLIYYVRLVSTFDFRVTDDTIFGSYLGHMAQSYIASNFGYSLTTIHKYNKLLTDLEIIYIHKSGYNMDNHTRCVNVYGFYKYKNKIINYAIANGYSSNAQN